MKNMKKIGLIIFSLFALNSLFAMQQEVDLAKHENAQVRQIVAMIKSVETRSDWQFAEPIQGVLKGLFSRGGPFPEDAILLTAILTFGEQFKSLYGVIGTREIKKIVDESAKLLSCVSALEDLRNQAYDDRRWSISSNLDLAIKLAMEFVESIIGKIGKNPDACFCEHADSICGAITTILRKKLKKTEGSRIEELLLDRVHWREFHEEMCPKFLDKDQCGVLRTTMRLCGPWRNVSACCHSYILNMRHIIDGNATGGNHYLANRADLNTFMNACGDTFTENAISHVLFGVRNGADKTMFPLGTTPAEIIEDVLHILNDRDCVICCTKLAENELREERWRVLGKVPRKTYCVEIFINESKRLVETAYPVFCLADWTEGSKDTVFAGVVPRQSCSRSSMLKIDTDDVLDCVCHLILGYMRSGCEKFSGRKSEDSPVRYLQKNHQFVDIAPALRSEDLTKVGKGVLVRVLKDSVASKIEEMEPKADSRIEELDPKP